MAGAVLPGFLMQTARFGDFPNQTAYSGTESDESGTPEQTQMSPTTSEEDDEPDNIRKQGPKSRYFPSETKSAGSNENKRGKKRASVPLHIGSERIKKSPPTSEPDSFPQLCVDLKTEYPDPQVASTTWYQQDKYSHRPSTWDPFTELEPDTTDPAYKKAQTKNGVDLNDDLMGDTRYEFALKMIRKSGAKGQMIPLREVAKEHMFRESDAYDVGFFLRQFGAAECVDDAHSGYITLKKDFDWDVLDARRELFADLKKYDAADETLDAHIDLARKTLDSLKKEYPYSYVTKDDLNLKSNSIILAKTYGAKHKATDFELKVTNAKNVVKVEGADLFNVRWPKEAVTEIGKIKKRNAAITIDKQNGFKEQILARELHKDLTDDDIAKLRDLIVQPSKQMEDGRSIAQVLVHNGVDPTFISLITKIPKEELVEPPKKKYCKEENMEKRRQLQRERAKAKRDEERKKREETGTSSRSTKHSRRTSVHRDVARLNADSSSNSSTSPAYSQSSSDSSDNAHFDSEYTMGDHKDAMLHYEEVMLQYRDEMFSYGDDIDGHGDEMFHHGDGMLHLGEDILLQGEEELLEEEELMEGEEVFIEGQEVIHEEEEFLYEGEEIVGQGDDLIYQGDKILHHGDGMVCPKDGTFSLEDEQIILGDNGSHDGGKKLHQVNDDHHQNGHNVLRMLEASNEDENSDYAESWVDEQNFDDVSPLPSPTRVMLSPNKCHLVPDRSCLSIGAELANNPGFQETLQMLSPIRAPQAPRKTVLQSEKNNDVGPGNIDKRHSKLQQRTDVFNVVMPEDYLRIALGNDEFNPDEFDQYLNNVEVDQLDINALFRSPGKNKIDDNFNIMKENDNIFRN
ncbi:hypothetical protein CAEBREN_23819 [Caenorhabditis brenneri]|uniref:Uncharacterized protein n=1 Tax=Caenorhabditis brenneri TaxID=135651 RepID=G0MBN3_CAEBE|nr:hypothetical protein CAEBREN_23819 [Caenorhabditis brenneri]